MPTLPRPLPGDYAPYQADYLALVPEGDLVTFLGQQAEEVAELDLTESEALSRYAPGKWSPKELLGHLIDAERILAYRLLRIARGDSTPLEGFDQDAYILSANFDARDWEDLVAEFLTVRGASISLVESLNPEAYAQRGVANGFSLTASTLAHLFHGHAAHHLNILRKHYLG